MKKYHKVVSRDCRAVFYDGKNAKDIEKEDSSVVSVVMDAEDKNVVEVRYSNAGHVRTLYPNQWLVFDGADVYTVKDDEFQRDFVEAK